MKKRLEFRSVDEGRLRSLVHERAPLEDADRVLDDLAAGRVVGRSVLVP